MCFGVSFSWAETDFPCLLRRWGNFALQLKNNQLKRFHSKLCLGSVGAGKLESNSGHKIRKVAEDLMKDTYGRKMPLSMHVICNKTKMFLKSFVKTCKDILIFLLLGQGQ